jgi:hypothetical protein
VADRSEDAGAIRSAVVDQWRVVGTAALDLDLARPSRLPGWRNREVMAHLAVQPVLLGRFLLTASDGPAAVDVTTNLAETRSFRAFIDESAREGARLGKVDLLGSLESVLPDLMTTPVDATIVTFQGAISLSDYLVTRCVEGVVHGRDLVGPVAPDPVAEAVTARALCSLLAATAPELVPVAESRPVEEWIDLATGRRTGGGALAPVLPLMA